MKIDIAAPIKIPSSPLSIAMPTSNPTTAPRSPIDGSTNDKGLREIVVRAAILSAPQFHIINTHNLIIGPVQDQNSN